LSIFFLPRAEKLAGMYSPGNNAATEKNNCGGKEFANICLNEVKKVNG
jgi:hypothetical protein